MRITNVELPESKFLLKCPYTMVAEGVAVHNTANDASAMAEISYMQGNDSSTSFHVAIDDYQVVTGLPFNRNGWHAGDGRNGKGNRTQIGIEICYSKSGGERFEEAEKLAAKYIAYLLKQYGWGIEKVSKHQDYSGKYCPHRTLDLGWERFLNLIRAELGQETTPSQTQNVSEDIVAIIQRTLNSKYGLNIAVDNLFGRETKGALVKGLQIELNNLYNRKLDVDGVFGNLTYNACVSIRKGAYNNLVWILQAILIIKGYSIALDADFGTETENAVKSYQASHGLVIDGIAGKNTFRSLLS